MKILEEIVTALYRPIEYVSKNSFINLDIVKGLETHITSLTQQALSLPLSSEKSNLIQELARNFVGFDSLDSSTKKMRIENSLRVLERIKEDHQFSVFQEKEALEKVFSGSPKELSMQIQFVKGVGPKWAVILKKKGVETIEDALYFLPRKYEDRRTIKTIAQLEVGKTETVLGEILLLGGGSYKKNRKRIFEMIIRDKSGTLTAKWFAYNEKYLQGRFKKGQKVILSGEIKVYRFQKEVHHPDIEVVQDMEDSLSFNRIVPVYSETEGVYQKTIRRIMKEVVDRYSDFLHSSIPLHIRQRKNLMALNEAIRKVHFPELNDDFSELASGRASAYRTIVFDELFFLELGLAIKKKGVSLERGISFEIRKERRDRFIRTLPFSLTNAQKRVICEIDNDMRCPHPMNRLLQGDVGSGKTIVALISALTAVDNGSQVAIMAPTEILAEQHFLNIHHLTNTLGVKTVILTSTMKKAQREKALKSIKAGDIDIVIGTHAVIQETVEFKNLCFGVIDEQHKFGVLQRAVLKRKGDNPDILVMTATPIPRTLAMTVYGDLEVSVLDELPPGRQPVTTKLYHEKDRGKVYEIVRKELTKGRQAYVVYPLVEESEKLDLKDATGMAERLQRKTFPEFKVGLLHGRMPHEKKEAVMLAFKEKKVDILAATTVIEVGIDVPNASVMLIEHAERFGLPQLHQLRGRVGRGKEQSKCLLLAQYGKTDDAKQRLKVMEATTDGFRIAEEDLAIRGPGDFLGTRQSGLPDFRVANIVRDIRVLQEARKEAFAIVEGDPELIHPSHRAMKKVLLERWKGRLELASVG